MAETIASFLMENLEGLMSCKRDLIREEEDQISWLFKDLQLLIAFLKDLQMRFKDHEGAKNLEARIRDVVYEAETAVDLFIVNTVLKDEEEENMITKRLEEIGISEKTGHDRSLNLGHVKKEIEAIKTEVNEMKMVKLRHVRVTGSRYDIDIESPDNLVDYPLFMDNFQTLSWINPWSWTDVLARQIKEEQESLGNNGLQVKIF
ncbi:hypothetical protein C3L33_17234, partial [Rhododendron williamsianum]